MQECYHKVMSQVLLGLPGGSVPMKGAPRARSLRGVGIPVHLSPGSSSLSCTSLAQKERRLSVRAGMWERTRWGSTGQDKGVCVNNVPRETVRWITVNNVPVCPSPLRFSVLQRFHLHKNLDSSCILINISLFQISHGNLSLPRDQRLLPGNNHIFLE